MDISIGTFVSKVIFISQRLPEANGRTLLYDLIAFLVS